MESQYKNTLDALSQKILENLDLVWEHFGIEINERAGSFDGACPIHADSDNPNAFSIYKNTGIWQCRTHGCHQEFHKTPLGLLRGLISQDSGWNGPSDRSKKASINDTIVFANKLFGGQIIERAIRRPRDRHRALQVQQPSPERLNISTYLKSIQSPSEYYLQRGFDEKILKKFMVGDYCGSVDYYKNRAIVPILNQDGSYIIGLSGRIKSPRCLVCNGYHERMQECPDAKYNPGAYQKWRHSKGFSRQNTLYNYWNMNGGPLEKIIIVEGPSEVWKLEECGIQNALAIFGSNITQRQTQLILELKPRLVTTIMDNDEGGLHAEESLCKQLKACKSNVKLQNFVPPANDLGEMTRQEILQWLRNI